jgi:hypothetical protein
MLSTVFLTPAGHRQDKRSRSFSILGASPPAAGTGLSACIFFACGKKGYRFNPLRGSQSHRDWPKTAKRFWLCKAALFPQNPHLFFRNVKLPKKPG